MTKVNVSNGAKVRVFVTPARIARGVMCDTNSCPIALALIEQLGAVKVSAGLEDAAIRLANGAVFELIPLGDNHRLFISRFDKNVKGLKRINISYRVKRVTKSLIGTYGRNAHSF